MKPAIEALAMADHFFLPIESGKKRITIREGHRDYTVGSPMILFYKGAPEHWVFQTKVESVRHTSLAKITQEEGEADGFTSPEDMLDGMRQFYYPHMDMESDVTVITWGDVS